MRTASRTVEIPTARSLTAMLALTAIVLLGYAHRSFAATSGPKTFASAAEACHALHQAVASHDEQALEAILGVGKEVTSQGDEAADKQDRDQFIQKYQEMHRLVKEPDGTTVLYIGAENWPFPIPLVSKNGRWLFDADTGKQEILFRQVGENEATAIEVCHALVAGEKAATDDPISQYAQQRGRDASLRPEPFHGYYFRPVKGQPGDTRAGNLNGKKPGSLAFIAYPAKYRASGVLTFIVTAQGAVYERDLGPNTTTLAQAMKQRPVSGWEQVN
jgi:Protein of unknown function (DUF2950)